MNVALPKMLKSTERQHRASFGLTWSVTTQLVSTAVKILSTVFLTRLLAPDAYALLGTAMIALTTLEWLSDLGIMPALVRHPSGDSRTVLLVGWWVNLFRSCAMAAVTLLLALPLAWIYQKPELAAVIGALALRPLLMGLRSPGVPLLRRRLDYRSLFIDEIAQTAIGASCSLLCAYWFGMNFGAWALVIGTMAGALTGVVISYILVPFRLRWVWDKAIAKLLGQFGSAVLLNTALMAAWLNCDRLIAPAFVSLTDLGFYIIAWNLISAGEAFITRSLDVYYSYLSRANSESRRKIHQRIANYLLMSGIVLSATGIVVAPHIVGLLYDPRYAGVGMLFAVLVARLAVRAAGQFDFQLLLVQGTIKWPTIAYLAGATTQCVLIYPLVKTFGVVGLAYSAFLSTVIVSSVSCIGHGLGLISFIRVLLISSTSILLLILVGTPLTSKTDAVNDKIGSVKVAQE